MAVDTFLSVLLSPLLLAQTAWTVSRAQRLPEPDGPRAGTIGTGMPLRFLVLGDSSAAGVGVATQDQALAPQLAAHLGRTRQVHWHLCAENGATTADAPRLLSPVRGQTFDAAFAIFGVNDAKNLRPAHHWRRDLRAMLDMLQRDHAARTVFVSGLPPVGDFPLIPHPLRAILGMRTRRFDRALQRIVAETTGTVHLPIAAGLDRAGMASDGFHPGAPIYAEWAEGAAAQMQPHLP